MEVVYGLENLFIKNSCAVCIGNFDGLHLGHRLIISVLKEEAAQRGLKSVIMTFEPHPFKYFNKPLKLISTPAKRMDKFLEQKTDYLVIVEFNKSLANLSPEQFVKDILVAKLHAALVIVGTDYRFGSGKAGNTALLAQLGAKYGFQCMFAHKLKDKNGIDISSSRIRSLLEQGQVEEAGRFLSCPYSLEGEVIHGDKMGRAFGYPTINLKTVNEMIPAFGVYAAKVKIKNEIYNAMTYIGKRPTINNRLELRVEANIFDFNEEIYGEYAEIILYKYIRSDIKFNSLDELIVQMSKDKEEIQVYFKDIDNLQKN
ncbi:MAG: riboflavin biosynthesis protein RibF [Mucispirillum sp.]|nr:riboflavin biosynthesis protein RibF [Mucispirillum sp.]